MLFQPQFEEYKGEDLSELIGDEWMEIECDCKEECKECDCEGV
jgi:hypothetical protein